MSKAVMISIKPKLVELIASGEKTVEIRKSRPKIDVPFKCYIYKTRDEKITMGGKSFDVNGGGKVVGEFTCNKISMEIVGYRNGVSGYHTLLDGSCLDLEQLMNYGKLKTLYGWNISNLKMYGKPKELSEFRLWNRPECAYGDLGYATPKSCDGCNNPPCHVQRAFQSWGYVEELK